MSSTAAGSVTMIPCSGKVLYFSAVRVYCRLVASSFLYHGLNLTGVFSFSHVTSPVSLPHPSKAEVFVTHGTETILIFFCTQVETMVLLSTDPPWILKQLIGQGKWNPPRGHESEVFSEA